MIIDHIFIFSDEVGNEADELANFGLIEGSSRVHKGQGTANRKFYFKNFFLEVLWVANQEEISSKSMQSTKLFERSDFQNNGASSFGLCLVNEPSSDQVFENSYQYKPVYFPPNMPIEVVTNNDYHSLPWTFRLPFKGVTENTNEPTEHSRPINRLTKAIFQYEILEGSQSFTEHFDGEEQIEYIQSDKNHLILEFDDLKEKRTKHFDSLPLTIKY
ncbi:MAG: hypothetical protein AAFQ94_27645 [Bacteroidota bacterium]